MIQLINIPDKCKGGGERLSAKKHRELKEENLASFANLYVQMVPVITTSAKPIITPKGFLVLGEASKPVNAEFWFLLYQLSRNFHLRGRNPRLLKGEAGLYQSCSGRGLIWLPLVGPWGMGTQELKAFLEWASMPTVYRG